MENNPDVTVLRVMPLVMLLLTCGCVWTGDNNEAAQFYLSEVHDTLAEVTSNMNDYSNMRSLYFDQKLNASDIRTAVASYKIKNDVYVQELDSMEPPAGYEKFHQRVISLVGHYSSAYDSDLSCLKSNDNTSCANTMNEIRLARADYDDAKKELADLGVNLYV